MKMKNTQAGGRSEQLIGGFVNTKMPQGENVKTKTIILGTEYYRYVHASLTLSLLNSDWSALSSFCYMCDSTEDPHHTHHTDEPDKTS